jgi:hypothetical protein
MGKQRLEARGGKADVRCWMLDVSEGCALRKAEVRGQRLEVSEGCALARESLQIKEKSRCWMLDVSGG